MHWPLQHREGVAANTHCVQLSEGSHTVCWRRGVWLSYCLRHILFDFFFFPAGWRTISHSDSKNGIFFRLTKSCYRQPYENVNGRQCLKVTHFRHPIHLRLRLIETRETRSQSSSTYSQSSGRARSSADCSQLPSLSYQLKSFAIQRELLYLRSRKGLLIHCIVIDASPVFSMHEQLSFNVVFRMQEQLLFFCVVFLMEKYILFFWRSVL